MIEVSSRKKYWKKQTINWPFSKNEYWIISEKWNIRDFVLFFPGKYNLVNI